MVGPPKGSVRMGYVQALLDYLDNHHAEAKSMIPEALLAGLNSESLNDRIPIAQWGDLLNHAITLSGDPALPLRVAEELAPRHWGVFAYAAMSCVSLAEVVGILDRYERLIDEINDTRINVFGDRAGLEWIPRCEAPVPAFMQLSVASWAVFARRYTNRPDLIADVHFTFPAPADTSAYKRIFGGEVQFSQASTQLIFPINYLQLPVTHHDADVNRILMTQLQMQLEGLASHTDFIAQLRNTIYHQLSKGRASLEHVASALGMAPRSLQYKLDEQGLSFREVLDDVQLSLARKYLQDPAMSIVDVAFLLGYSEQSAFQKAFKRWTNETPGEFRKRVLQGHI